MYYSAEGDTTVNLLEVHEKVYISTFFFTTRLIDLCQYFEYNRSKFHEKGDFFSVYTQRMNILKLIEAAYFYQRFYTKVTQIIKKKTL